MLILATYLILLSFSVKLQYFPHGRPSTLAAVSGLPVGGVVPGGCSGLDGWRALHRGFLAVIWAPLSVLVGVVGVVSVAAVTALGPLPLSFPLVSVCFFLLPALFSLPPSVLFPGAGLSFWQASPRARNYAGWVQLCVA